jgi:hypothetical protein
LEKSRKKRINPSKFKKRPKKAEKFAFIFLENCGILNSTKVLYPLCGYIGRRLKAGGRRGKAENQPPVTTAGLRSLRDLDSLKN